MTAPKAPKVVRAERFEVVDAEGRVRARIGPRSRRNSDGTWRSIRLELFDANDTVCASLSVVDGTSQSTLLVGPSYGESHVRIWRTGVNEEHDIPQRAAVDVVGGPGTPP